ncbi:hypothetical protein D9619_009808 [Psilocybe cf. subviscida]|uniref:NACHT domain-containing protein n=1 Tax=Psilocybe cf. subviscida TaxID=2480587 RepID=A0A8H5BL46_9AGAR|nr:hypothetical protein D9619_009808 [Psilocybe cf. subviscida]
MSTNKRFKKLGMSLKKKFTNLKSDLTHSAAKVEHEMDIKESGPSVLDRTASNMSMERKESDSVKNHGDNADAQTLVDKPLIAREDTTIHVQTSALSKKEEVTKSRRVQQLAYEGLKESLRTVERCSDFFPPLKSATNAVLEVIERYETVKDIPDKLADLASKFGLLVNLLNSVDNNDSIKDRLNGLVTTFEEKAKVIAAKLERSMAARVIESSEDKSFITRELNAIAFSIDIVLVDVNLKTNRSVNLLQESVSELRVIALLDKLKYVAGAGFNHEDRQGCTNGTRIMLLADLLAWATDPENEHVFWLNGMAGTGKTTVAETFCNLLFHRGLLGASFFCSRKKLDRRNVRLIIPALAKGLARAYPEFQTELLKILKDDLDFTGLGLEDQYLTLILQPAEKAYASSSKMIVLVIDALDECEDTQAAEMFLKTVLLRKPTCGLRLLVTSRPESKILKGFGSGSHASLRLQDIEAHLVKGDIAVFLRNTLKEVEDLYTEYGSTWPPAEVQTIVDHAGTLFIYAATAVKYISDDHGDPVERLAKFASIQPPVNAVEGIDEVYAYVLAEAFSHKLDDAEIARIKACLSMVVCALEPIYSGQEGLFLPAFCGSSPRK